MQYFPRILFEYVAVCLGVCVCVSVLVHILENLIYLENFQSSACLHCWLILFSFSCVVFCFNSLYRHLATISIYFLKLYFRCCCSIKQSEYLVIFLFALLALFYYNFVSYFTLVCGFATMSVHLDRLLNILILMLDSCLCSLHLLGEYQFLDKAKLFLILEYF